MHGIFYDTSSTRSVLGPEIHGDDPNYAPEKEQEDLDEAANVVEWTRNFWRDNVLVEPVTVIANTGDSGSSGLLMKAKEIVFDSFERAFYRVLSKLHDRNLSRCRSKIRKRFTMRQSFTRSLQ